VGKYLSLYIYLLYSLTIAQWSKQLDWVIDALLQCHLRLHMLYYYKYNIHRAFLRP
jgi:hypothetical protein